MLGLVAALLAVAVIAQDFGPGVMPITKGGGGTPGGANTQIQYNSGGAFAGSSELTWASPALTISPAAAALVLLNSNTSVSRDNTTVTLRLIAPYADANAGVWANIADVGRFSINNNSYGSQTTWRVTTATTTCNSGTGTCTLTGAIPAGSLVYGVTLRVTTVLAGAGLTTFQVGDGTTANAFGATVAVAANTTTDFTTHLATWKPTLYTAATNVVLTANAGVFSSGAVRVCIHRLTVLAPTS